MGFCMGGMYALKAASTGRYDVAVSFYGMIRVPVAWRGPDHAEPLALLAGERTSPVLAIIGGKDPFTPSEDVAELSKLGALVRVVKFPDAEHGFVHDPDRPAHRPDDATQAWHHVVSFLS
jgi:carboxymethylenebutenolidase